MMPFNGKMEFRQFCCESGEREGLAGKKKEFGEMVPLRALRELRIEINGGLK